MMGRGEFQNLSPEQMGPAIRNLVSALETLQQQQPAAAGASSAPPISQSGQGKRPVYATTEETHGGLIPAEAAAEIAAPDLDKTDKRTTLEILKKYGVSGTDINRVLQKRYGSEYITASDPSGWREFVANPYSMFSNDAQIPPEYQVESLRDAIKHHIAPWRYPLPVVPAR